MKALLLGLMALFSLSSLAQKPQFIPKAHKRINVSNDIPDGIFALIDLDQDGDKDLVVEKGWLQLYQNQGDGNFILLPQPCAFQIGAEDIQVVDFGADGDEDLVVSTGQGQIALIENLDSLRFRRIQDSIYGDLVVNIMEAGDLNGDAYPDLILSGRNPQWRSEMRLYFGDSTGRFQSDSTIGPYPGINSNGDIAIGDLDDDGDQDILFSGSVSWGVNNLPRMTAVLWKNQSGYSLDSNSFVRLESSILGIADLNGDSKNDIVLSGETRNPSQQLMGIIYQQTSNGFAFTDTFRGTDTRFATRHSIAFEDREGDGDLDFYILGDIYSNGSYRWVENKGSGTYTSRRWPTEFFTHDDSYGFAIADLNQDGRSDYLASANRERLHIWMQDSSNQVHTTTNHFDPGLWTDFASGYIDGDSLLDFIVVGNNPLTGYGRAIPKIFLNDGSGNYDAYTDPDIPLYDDEVQLVDVDGDGDDDLFIAGAYGSLNEGVKLLINDGSGNFAAPTSLINQLSSAQIVPADFDSDGDFDIVVAYHNGSSTNPYHTKLFKNDGSGNFSEFLNHNLPGVRTINNEPLHLIDYNADGHLDLLMPMNYQTDLYLNDSNGVFQKDSVRSAGFVGLKFAQLARGDLDLDGNQDFVAFTDTNRGSNRFKLRFFYGDGQGNYSVSAPLRHMGQPALNGGLILRDLDGDSLLDLIGLGAGFPNGTSIYWNDSTQGFFRDSAFFEYDRNVGAYFTDDVDGDGDQDIVSITRNVNDGLGIGKVWLQESCPYYQVDYSLSTCRNYYWEIGGCVLNQSGTYTAVVQNGNCKEEYTLNLTILPQPRIIMTSDSLLQSDTTALSYQWLICDTSGLKSPIANATSQSYNPPQSGWYAVVNFQGNCSDTSECFLYEVLSNPEEDSHQAKAYPNPFQDQLALEELELNSSIQIINSAGQVLLEKKAKDTHLQLELSALKPGVYLLQVRNPDGALSSQRLIKN